MGGGAANASHLTNDLMKLCRKNALCGTDNVPFFTAKANDEGLASVFDVVLRPQDALFVFSVGGGTETVSVAISNAVRAAKNAGARIFGIVGPVLERWPKQGN